jgi:enterobactin synthetase component D
MLTTRQPVSREDKVCMETLASQFGWASDVLSDEVSYSRWQPSPQDLAKLPDDLSRASESRRRDYAAGRLCAGNALTRSGYAWDGELRRGDDRLPMWPPGTTGSISHCKLGAVAVVAPTTMCRAIGVDMEAWIEDSTASNIWEHIANEAEFKLLNHVKKSAALTLLFSAKEALFKALYPDTRQIMEFNAARLIRAQPDHLTFALTCLWSGQWQAGNEINVNVVTSNQCVYSGVYIPQS